MKVVSIIGARPQFIKAAPISMALRNAGHAELLMHTGQHYDANMSEIFFRQLGIPDPDINLGIGSAGHGAQTGAMLIAIEEALLTQKADWALIYGDTNSTLAGALAAAKLHCPVAHVEAGLRSFNRSMPEEINRIVADHVSTILLCPSKTAVENLAGEGIARNVHLVGDVMLDAILLFSEQARLKSTILHRLDLEPRAYLLATVHRSENTDNPIKLRKIVEGFGGTRQTIIFPVHPRTQRALESNGLLQSSANSDKPANLVRGTIKGMDNIYLIDPVGYLDSLMLQQNARMILTDSGGMQKEAYWLGIPCITLRAQTEWVETVESGWNVLAGAEPSAIVAAVANCPTRAKGEQLLYGDGHAAERCVDALSRFIPEIQ